MASDASTPVHAGPATGLPSPRVERLATRFLGFLVVAFVVALGYAIVRSHRHSGATGLVYVAVPAVAVLLLTLALRRRPYWRVRIAAISFACLLTLLLLEAAICLFLTPPTLRDLWEEHGIQYDPRGGAEVAIDLRTQGEDVYPNVSGLLFRDERPDLAPIGSVSHKRIAFSNESGPWLFFQSDKHGFHNDDAAWDAPSVVLVGDSFCEGVGVPREHNFAGQLNASGHKTLNLGWAGFGPLWELATIREYAQPLRPKHVFWMYFEGNDLTDLESSFRGVTFLRPYFDDVTYTQRLIDRQGEIDALYEASVAERLKHFERRRVTSDGIADSRIARILRLYHLRARLARLFRTQPPIPPQFAQILERARDQVDAWGGRLHFVYLPEFARYAQNTDGEWRHRKRALEIVAALGIPIIDIHAVFSAQPEPLDLFHFRVNTHYNRAGCGLVAGAVAQAIGADR